MKIFRSDQIRQIDELTVRNESITSADLMERAVNKIYKWLNVRFDRSRPVTIFAGPGNNGGDGLALARILSKERYDVEIFYVQFSGHTSGDWMLNRKRLEDETSLSLNILTNIDQFPVIQVNGIIIDAIFGSGLSGQVKGLASEVIRKINSSAALVVSVDIPSGLSGEDNTGKEAENIVRASYTLSFQFPKLSFMFSENEKFTGEWNILPIGLDNKVIESVQTPYCLLGSSFIASLLKKRNKFDHKGNFGHGLFAGGSYGKMGAVILGAKAALRSGIGLITCYIPSCGNQALQTAVPEAMVIDDRSERYISGVIPEGNYSAVGIGPGMDTKPETKAALLKFLKVCKTPLVLDADALNILAGGKDSLEAIPAGSIITPHPKEFERLAGNTPDGFARLKKQVGFSAEHKCIVIIKGAYTSVVSPEGRIWFNSTGNPGMATAGCGDVLTGIILSLLAQGYSSLNAALTGVYLHGLAGDIAAEESGYESLIASDIVNALGKAFRTIRMIK